MSTTLREAYSKAEQHNAERNRKAEQRILAERFKPNERMEAALKLKKTDAAAFSRLNRGSTRIEIALYTREKAAHEQELKDTQ